MCSLLSQAQGLCTPGLKSGQGVEASAQSGNNCADRSTVSVRACVRSSVYRKAKGHQAGSTLVVGWATASYVTRHAASSGWVLKVHDPAPAPATHGPSHQDLHSCRPPCLEQGSGAHSRIYPHSPTYPPLDWHFKTAQPLMACCAAHVYPFLHPLTSRCIYR